MKPSAREIGTGDGLALLEATLTVSPTPLAGWVWWRGGCEDGLAFSHRS